MDSAWAAAWVVTLQMSLLVKFDESANGWVGFPMLVWGIFYPPTRCQQNATKWPFLLSFYQWEQKKVKKSCSVNKSDNNISQHLPSPKCARSSSTSDTAVKYAVKFRTYSAQSGWNKVCLMSFGMCMMESGNASLKLHYASHPLRQPAAEPGPRSSTLPIPLTCRGPTCWCLLHWTHAVG